MSSLMRSSHFTPRGALGGAQCYPFCINLAATGTGSANPSGVSAETCYTPSDPGIFVNIYQMLSAYVTPGPAV